jgi:tetratricopeptide (TPR) repeat protein
LDLLGEDHPNTASSLNNIGLVYSDQGNYKKALEVLEKSFKITLNLFGQNHPDTASSLNNIGSVYSN